MSEWAIGSLTLAYDMPINEKVIEEAFPGYAIEKIEWKQEGINTVGYVVSKSGEEIIAFKAQDEKQELLDSIYSKYAIDQYSVSINTKYREIKSIRPKAIYETTYHFHTYVGVKNSNIAYQIDGDYAPIENNRADRSSFAESELLNWKVIELIWRKPPEN